MTSSVVVVGSINVDVVVRTPHLPQAGETVLGGDPLRLPGGKGANQAVALARLGLSVTLVGAVGDDPDGALSLEALRDQVDVTGVRVVPAPTGLALITVDDRGENTIVVASGANALALAPMVIEADAVVLQLELPLQVVADAVQAAQGLVVLNAAPAAALPHDLLERVDVLVVNDVEARAIAGTGTAAEAVEVLSRQVRRGVVVTLGGAGCLVGDRSGQRSVPGLAVPVIDTVGAGDAFVATLTWALLAGGELGTAAALGCAAGAFAVGRHGARSSPTLTELQGMWPNRT